MFRKVQFNIMPPNKNINIKIDSKDSIVERTKKQLHQAYMELENLVKKTSTKFKDPSTMLVICCGEDFFKGGELTTQKEEEKGIGKCMDRDTVFSFFTNEMRKLSKSYPYFVIIPGSVYVSIDAKEEKELKFNQDGQNLKTKPDIFVQNISPVFYNGDWIRLLKKGDYLSYKPKKAHIQFFKKQEELSALPIQSKIIVPQYREDDLISVNRNLVVVGETKLAGEEALLTSLLGDKYNPESFYAPLFEIEDINFAVSICGDISWNKIGCFLKQKDLKDQKSDIFIVLSNGIAPRLDYCDPTAGKGYYVQADAESNKLCQVLLKEKNLLKEGEQESESLSITPFKRKI